MSAFEAVVVIGSQGALGPLLETLECLPSGFPVAMIVDLHRNGRHAGAEGLIERRAGMRARVAHDGATPGAGTVHLAPHDRQLTLTGERLLRVADAADDRPWPRRADLLMRSAAEALGSRVIGVVLSGRLDAGAAGALEIKRRGGRVLVQDPVSAVAPSMPSAALATGCVDFALPPRSLAQAVAALCASPGAAELFRVRLNAGVRQG